jgi:hypothetical protein
MAAASKPTAVHFTLIFFVMMTLIFGVMSFMFYKEAKEVRANLAQSQKDATSNKTAAMRAQEETNLLKKLVGHEFADIGALGAANANTVVGAMQADISLAGEPAQPTYTAAIHKLFDDYREMTANRDKLRADFDQEHAALLALQSQYQQRVDEQQKAKQGAEGDLQKKIRETDEQLAQKENDIATLKTSNTEMQNQMQQDKDSFDKQVKILAQRITNLEKINNKLRDELDTVKRYSFEEPDGKIAEVDNTGRMVAIDLGEADLLPVRTTFSVYGRNNNGVGRNPEDIKAEIEVTRILGPHLAEAKILKEDIYNPIGIGDAIYTPLWSVGRSEHFAVIGGIDINGDKKSDRGLLHEIVRASGARITDEVDDNGERHGTGIDVNTKFLVIGKIPDLTDLEEGETEDATNKITEHLKAMRQEAREQGVRIVSLGDFLTYSGVKPQERLFRPGDQRPYNLTAGSKSASVKKDAVSTAHKSSGNTAYSKTFRPKGPQSQSRVRSGPTTGY